MDKYEFIDSSGKSQTVEAKSADAALRSAKNIGSSSGVRLLKDFNAQPSPDLDPTQLGGSTPDLPSKGTRGTIASKNVSANVMSTQASLQNIFDKVAAGEDVSQQELLRLQAAQSQGFLDLLKGKEGKAEMKKDLVEEKEVLEKKNLAREYNDKIEAEQRALQERSDRAFSDTTLTKEQRQQQLNLLERDSLRKQADLAMLAKHAQGDYTAALADIDYILDLEYGDVEEDIENYQLQVQAVSGLSSSLKSQLTQQAQDEKDRIKEVRSYQENLYKLATQTKDTSIAQQLVNRANQITSDSTIEDAAQIYNSAYGSAISSGAFITGTGEDLSSRQKDFLKDASEFIGDLAAGDLDWGAAWNQMRTKYPEATNDEIDAALQKANYYPFDTDSGAGSFVKDTGSKLLSGIGSTIGGFFKGSSQKEREVKPILPNLEEGYDPYQGILDAYKVVKDNL